MSNYVKTIDFAAKDALPTGNPAKVASGTQVDDEFDAIATAIATKEDTANKNANNGYAGLDSSGDVERANLPTATAYTDTANVFTANQEIEGSAPVLTIDETDAVANERTWLIRSVGGNLTVSTATDAAPSTPVNNPIVINRTGTAVDSIVLDATTVLKGANTMWHSGNDGTGSGLDADLLDGFNASDSATSSTIVARNASGHVYATNFNQSSSNSENPVISQILVTNGSDDFLRKASLAHLAGYLGLKVAYGYITSAGALNTGKASANITSVTKNSTGDYTVNYTAAGFTDEPLVLAITSGSAGFTSLSAGGPTNFTTATVFTYSTGSGGSAVGITDRDFVIFAVGV